MTRVLISKNSTPVPCEDCGHPTLHVARLMSGEGELVGQTMVCTTCHPHRPDERPEDRRRA